MSVSSSASSSESQARSTSLVVRARSAGLRSSAKPPLRTQASGAARQGARACDRTRSASGPERCAPSRRRRVPSCVLRARGERRQRSSTSLLHLRYRVVDELPRPARTGGRGFPQASWRRESSAQRLPDGEFDLLGLGTVLQAIDQRATSWADPLTASTVRSPASSVIDVAVVVDGHDGDRRCLVVDGVDDSVLAAAG